MLISYTFITHCFHLLLFKISTYTNKGFNLGEIISHSGFVRPVAVTPAGRYGSVRVSLFVAKYGSFTKDHGKNNT